MDTIFAIMTEEKGNQKETLKINTSKLKKILSEEHNAEADGGNPSSNFWSVSCRGNATVTAANLLFSGSKYRELRYGE